MHLPSLWFTILLCSIETCKNSTWFGVIVVQISLEHAKFLTRKWILLRENFLAEKKTLKLRCDFFIIIFAINPHQHLTAIKNSWNDKSETKNSNCRPHTQLNRAPFIIVCNYGAIIIITKLLSSTTHTDLMALDMRSCCFNICVSYWTQINLFFLLYPSH